MNTNWKLQIHPETNAENILQGTCYRISVLTDGLIRLEYRKDGVFEDRPTQIVWNRNFPKTEFRCIETSDSLELFTRRVHLVYDKKEFSPNGLSIEIIGSFTAYSSIWHYGDTFETLGGTARTLDTADGAVPLEDGIISKNGFSVMDDSRSLILREDGWVEPRKGKGLDLYFWGYGHDYLDALKDFYHLCGKAPMVPRYALGNWWSRFYRYSEESYRELMERFEQENLPFSVAVIDMDWHLVDIDPKYGSGWTGYTWNRDLFPDPKRFMDWLHERHMHVTLNVHPANGVQAHEEAYLPMAKALGVDFEQEQPINFDVSDPAFLDAYFTYLHHPNEEMGVDFWWVDWQSGGISKVEGLDPLWMLNHYHYLDNGRDGKRPMTFSRYSGPGSHRYPVGFSGDTIVTWESLDFQPYFTATASNIGYGMWSHDIGGHMLGTKDDEMAGRWLQFGVFSPIMRLHSSNSEFNGKEPWRYQKEIGEMMGDFLRLRHRMIPYLYTMNHRAYAEDLPLILPMYYHYPEAEEAYQVPNQYEFGSELLAAPITSPRIPKLNVAKKTVWLPDGIWFDCFSGRTYRGGRTMEVYRDIHSMPLFAPAGAILPMTEELKNTEQNPRSLHIQIFPLADGAFSLYEDDGCTSKYLDGDFVTTEMSLHWGDTVEFTIEPPMGNLHLLPEKRSWKIEFRQIQPCQAELWINGQPSPLTTRYDKERRSFCLETGEIPADAKIQIRLFGVQAAENDISSDVFSFLNQAEIAFALKDRLYQKVSSSKDPILLLSELVAMDLDANLLGVLTELITA